MKEKNTKEQVTVLRYKGGGAHIKYPAIKEQSNPPIFWLYVTPLFFMNCIHYTTTSILEEVQELEEMVGILNILDATYTA